MTLLRARSRISSHWRIAISTRAKPRVAVAGFRAERANKHLRVIASLEFTVGLDKTTVRVLDRFRRKRHVAVYERVGAISDREATEMIEMAREIRRRVETWIRTECPELLSP